jgi:2-methylcitrate dehydratase PrpD
VTLDNQNLDRPWHPSAVMAPIAAAAAAARLLRLPAAQAANAIGIAASFAGGFQAQFGTHGKALHLGKGAMAGYLGAAMAAEGVTGDTEVLERSNGFGACFAPGASWRFMAHDLAGPLFVTSRHVRNTVGFGIAAKPWPWCGGAISAVTALEQILAKGPLRPDDIEEVELHEIRDRTKGPMFRSPYTGVGEHGKFSLPYSAAARLLFDTVSPHVHSDEAARKVLESGLLPKIRVVVQPFSEARPPISRVTIRMKDGRRLVGESFVHRRETEPGALMAKFRDATSPLLDGAAADRLFRQLSGLSQIENAGELLAMVNREEALAPP